MTRHSNDPASADLANVQAGGYPSGLHVTQATPRPVVAVYQRCVECGRVFNLMNREDAAEWYYGHDCEEG